MNETKGKGTGHCVVTMTIEPDNPVKAIHKNPWVAIKMAKKRFFERYQK
jgi:hypothetical protein